MEFVFAKYTGRTFLVDFSLILDIQLLIGVIIQRINVPLLFRDSFDNYDDWKEFATAFNIFTNSLMSL